MVRTVVGYHRYDTAAELLLMNKIWTLQSQMTNYFLPQVPAASAAAVCHRSCFTDYRPPAGSWVQIGLPRRVSSIPSTGQHTGVAVRDAGTDLLVQPRGEPSTVRLELHPDISTRRARAASCRPR